MQLRAAATILSYLVVIFRPEDGCHIPSIASNRTCLRAVGRFESKGWPATDPARDSMLPSIIALSILLLH